MRSFKKALPLFLIFSVLILLPAVSHDAYGAKNACNPCAKNACNPCAKNACNPCAKNACNPCNPCGKKMKNACNPCAKNACNPCNPCGGKPPKPIRSEHITSTSKLMALGKKLWNDENLSTNGQSCMGCHSEYDLFEDTVLKPYPHFVNMPKDIVTLDQMINFCMINPMEGKMLNSSSIEMTAMAAYFQYYIKSYKAPKNACNPCGKKRMRNACNPCGKRMKNACNPCNPCGRR